MKDQKRSLERAARRAELDRQKREIARMQKQREYWETGDVLCRKAVSLARQCYGVQHIYNECKGVIPLHDLWILVRGAPENCRVPIPAMKRSQFVERVMETKAGPRRVMVRS